MLTGSYGSKNRSVSTQSGFVKGKTNLIERKEIVELNFFVIFSKLNVNGTFF